MLSLEFLFEGDLLDQFIRFFMNELPVKAERELVDGLQKMLHAGEDGESYKNSCKLQEYNINLSYEIWYRNYHRLGNIEHGIEVVFELGGFGSNCNPDMEDAEKRSIEEDLTNIMSSELSFDDTVSLEREPDRYVFSTEVIHNFNQRA
jgi:hypothetical protein